MSDDRDYDAEDSHASECYELELELTTLREKYEKLDEHSKGLLSTVEKHESHIMTQMEDNATLREALRLACEGSCVLPATDCMACPVSGEELSKGDKPCNEYLADHFIAQSKGGE